MFKFQFDLKLSAQSGKKVHIDSDLSGNDASFNIIAVQNVLSFNENLNSQLGWINKNSQGNSVPIYFFIAVAGSNHLNIYSEGFPNSNAKFNYKDTFEIMSTNLSVTVMLGLKDISGNDASFNSVSATTFYGDVEGKIDVEFIASPTLLNIIPYASQSTNPAQLYKNNSLYYTGSINEIACNISGQARES